MDDPGDRAGVEQKCREIEPAESRRPAHQRAPGEGEAQKNLRPIRDALHERINRDHGERCDAGPDRKAIELQQHEQVRSAPAAAETRKRRSTLTWPDGIGRERVRSTRASMSRSTRSFQVQPAPRMAMAPTSISSRCQRFGPQRAQGSRPAPPTTSRATAGATSRSAGRGGLVADKGGSRQARGRQPSCRSHRRRVRRCRSSRQSGLPVMRVEDAVIRAWSSTNQAASGAPSTSLSLGPAGRGRRSASLLAIGRRSCGDRLGTLNGFGRDVACRLVLFEKFGHLCRSIPDSFVKSWQNSSRGALRSVAAWSAAMFCFGLLPHRHEALADARTAAACGSPKTAPLRSKHRRQAAMTQAQ